MNILGFLTNETMQQSAPQYRSYLSVGFQKILVETRKKTAFPRNYFPILVKCKMQKGQPRKHSLVSNARSRFFCKGVVPFIRAITKVFFGFLVDLYRE